MGDTQNVNTGATEIYRSEHLSIVLTYSEPDDANGGPVGFRWQGTVNTRPTDQRADLPSLIFCRREGGREYYTGSYLVPLLQQYNSLSSNLAGLEPWWQPSLCW